MTVSIYMTVSDFRAIASLGVLCLKPSSTDLPALKSIHMKAADGALLAYSTDRFVAAKMRVPLHESSMADAFDFTVLAAQMQGVAKALEAAKLAPDWVIQVDCHEKDGKPVVVYAPFDPLVPLMEMEELTFAYPSIDKLIPDEPGSVPIAPVAIDLERMALLPKLRIPEDFAKRGRGEKFRPGLYRMSDGGKPGNKRPPVHFERVRVVQEGVRLQVLLNNELV